MKKDRILTYLFLFLLLSTIGCKDTSNRAYFSINPEDRKMVVPVQLNDSVTANMVLDAGAFAWELNNIYLQNKKNAYIYTDLVL